MRSLLIALALGSSLMFVGCESSNSYKHDRAAAKSCATCKAVGKENCTACNKAAVDKTGCATCKAVGKANCPTCKAK
ncbi:MAG: hypothetical protein V3V20_02490 [Algisphaera sp.]